ACTATASAIRLSRLSAGSARPTGVPNQLSPLVGLSASGHLPSDHPDVGLSPTRGPAQGTSGRDSSRHLPLHAALQPTFALALRRRPALPPTGDGGLEARRSRDRRLRVHEAMPDRAPRYS